MADGLRTKLGTAISTDEYRSDIEEVVHFTDNSISDDAIFLRILHAPALQPRQRTHPQCITSLATRSSTA